MVEKTITIAIDANVQKFKKAMEQAKASMSKSGKAMKEETEKISTGVESLGKTGGFKAFVDSMRGVSPMFDGIADTVSNMKDRLKGAGKAGKLAMAGIGTAVGGLALGIGVMLGKAIMDTTGKLAKLADPARFDKASTEMKESLRTLKTSLGELASPIFEYMAKGVSLLAQGLTWVVEKVQMFVGLLQGLLGLGHKTNQTLAGTADAMDEAGASADAGLASFDKLTTLNVGEMGDMEQAKKMAKAMDDMRKKGAEMAKSIKGAFKPLTEGVAKLKEIFSMSPGEMWDKFKESAGNAWESIKNIGSSVWEGLKGVVTGYWDFVGNLAHNVWEGIKNIGSTIWEGLKSVVTGYWDFVGNAGRTIWNGLKDHVTKIFTTVADTLKGVFKGVVDVFKGAWDKAYGAIKGAIDWILGKIKWILDKIEGVKDFFGGIGDKVKDTFGSIGDKVKGALGIKAKDEPVADKGPSRTEQVRDQYMKAMMDHPENRDDLAREYSKLVSTIVPKSDAVPGDSIAINVSDMPRLEVPDIDVPSIEPIEIERLPEIVMPDVKVPTFEIPDLAPIKIESPDLSIPTLEVPKIPPLEVPDIPTLEVPKIPPLEVPKIPPLKVEGIPDLKAPTIDIPRVEVPKMKAPKIDVPDMSIQASAPESIPDLKIDPTKSSSQQVTRDDLMNMLNTLLANVPATAQSKSQDITLTLDGRVLARYLYDDLETEGSRRGSVIY